MFSDLYQTISQTTTVDFKDKGSRFIAIAQAIESDADVKQFLNTIKEQHPKATHHCYAYRLGLDKMMNYRANDDGEPSGTAGKPILGQIDSKQLTNVMVIVVRYFGGIKLGVSGLIHAYKTATKMVLEQAPIVQKQVLDYGEIQTDYTQINDLMRLLKKEQVDILEQKYFDTYQTISIRAGRIKSHALADELSQWKNLSYRWLYSR